MDHPKHIPGSYNYYKVLNNVKFSKVSTSPQYVQFEVQTISIASNKKVEKL